MQTVLVAEDDVSLREAYKTILETSGYRALEAENGKEALLHIKQANPDLLLLDMLMPVMTGLETLEELKTGEYPEIPVIAFTNLSDATTLNKLKDYGVHEYLLKSSVMPQDLVKSIEAALATKVNA